eukprot:TRINITY_DN12776_c0_g1_i1.p1 TRINITY_DN12776_c0_g1~~TRINITY_DN12776_c0_g1_i1.p1  ORF type:complete len:912 (+),score=84.73 TRINITY_DN12776_c0_g1_i1:228-2963(+)
MALDTPPPTPPRRKMKPAPKTSADMKPGPDASQEIGPETESQNTCHDSPSLVVTESIKPLSQLDTVVKRKEIEGSFRGIFLSLMGAVYFMAFASYYIQYQGLLGADGLLPAASFWNRVRDTQLQAMPTDQPFELDLRTVLGWWSNGVGAAVGLTQLDRRIPRVVLSPPGEMARTFGAFLNFPTWLWFLTGENGLHPDQALEGLALSGCCMAVLACIGVHHVVLFALLYMNYLSLYLLGQTWTGFQWDTFLLETGALLLPYCSTTSIRARGAKPPAAWLLRLLIAKFMYMNGVVKVRAQCPTWMHLTALEYHFASSPIPTAGAWFIHQFPPFILRLATALMFLIELIGPLLLLLPVKSMRRVGVVAQAVLQLGIMSTGNYNWFNFQTIVLCLPVWDADDYDDENGAYASLPLRLALLPARAWGWFWAGWFGCLAGIATGLGFLGWAFGKMFVVYSGTSAAPLRLVDIASWVVTAVIAPRATVATARQAIVGDHFRIRSVFGPLEINSFTATLLSSRAMNAMFVLIMVACVRYAFAPACGSRQVGSWRRAMTVGLIVGRLGNMFFILLIAVMCLLPFKSLGGGGAHVPFRSAALPFSDVLKHWRVTNSYGLFRRMTGVGTAPSNVKGWGDLPPSVVDVPALVVEGTDDGKTWREIPFRYTPGRPTKRPRYTAPHQPRLDWQMWFAALDSSYQGNPWFVHLIYKLLEGGGPAVDLLDVDAYPWKERDPPTAIRATLYSYDFTRLDTPWARSIPGTTLLPYEQVQEGVAKQWWTRRKKKSYLPPSSLQSLRELVRKQGWPVGREARAQAVAEAEDCRPARRGGLFLGFWCSAVISARRRLGSAASKRSGWSFRSPTLRRFWPGAAFVDVHVVLILGSLFVSVVLAKFVAPPYGHCPDGSSWVSRWRGQRGKVKAE